MIGTTGSQRREPLRPSGSGEDERVGVVGVVGDDTAVRRHRSPQRRQNLGSDIPAGDQGVMIEPAKESATLFSVRSDEFTHVIDGEDAVRVAFPLRVTPGGQAVARWQKPSASRI